MTDVAETTDVEPEPRPRLEGEGGRAAGPDLAHLLPRVDWRFLLPRSHLGRVAVDGRVDAEGRVALAGAADELHRLGDDDGGPFDTIVLTDPTVARLRAAIARVAPGGTVRIEAPARRRRRALRAALRAAGFTVGTWWARPTAVAPWCLIALDDRRAAATTVRTVAGRGRRGPIEGFAAGAGVPGRWSRHVALLATGPGADASAHAVASAGPDHPVAALVTPRYAASRSVVGISTGADGRRLGRVVKLARRPEHDGAIAAEGGALSAYAVGVSPRPPGSPRGHRLARHDGHLVLVEEAATGRPLDRREVRRDPASALAQGMDWLSTVPVGPPSLLRTDGRSRDLLIEPLRAIASLPVDDVATRRDRIRRTVRALEPLSRQELPTVFEHGDLSHPNLFTDPDRGLVAIDWERARPAGLPLQDLVFFLTYVAESLDRPRTAAELAASHHRAFGHGGWARPDIDLHAERVGVDLRLVPLLELVARTRTLARLAEPGTGDRPSEGHRYERLWIVALEQAEDRHR